MSEDIEKSLEERIEDARLEQILDIQTGASSSEVCDRHRWEQEGIIDENIKEHVEECLGEMLNNYIEDERNYIVDGAIIKCDRMSDEMACVQFREDGSQISIKGGGVTPSDYIKPADIGPSGYNPEWEEHIILSHAGDEYIRKLYAVHGSEQSANNIPFATVIDRTWLREAEETKGVDRALAEAGKKVSIIGCGNCKILREADIKKIAENWESVHKYGTCYLLMKLASSWINPYCMESVVGKCEGERLMSPLPSNVDNALKLAGGVANNAIELAVCAIEHHKTMRFSTTEGEKEGLTMLSTLLCTRGGVITIEAPGQIYIEPKKIIEGVSDNLIELLKSYETGAILKNGKYELLPTGEPALTAYHGEDDPPGVWTIGWGHAMLNENDGKITFEHIEEDGTITYITKNLYAGKESITYEEAVQLLNRDVAVREETINQELQTRGIAADVDQQFYDALFLLYYQVRSIFKHTDFSRFLNEKKFLNKDENREEIMLQFGDYTDGGSIGAKRRRADELDIIFYNDYNRDYDENRYGDIWAKMEERKNTEQ